MKRTSTETMTTVQKIFWNFTIGYFALVVIIYLINIELALTLSMAGVLGVIVMTLFRVIALAEVFRKADKKLYLRLSYILILLIATSFIIKVFS